MTQEIEVECHECNGTGVDKDRCCMIDESYLLCQRCKGTGTVIVEDNE